MSLFEFGVAVTGVVVMRFFIKDDTTYLITSAAYGFILGIVSGISKRHEK